jgi:hypothetical protein
VIVRAAVCPGPPLLVAEVSGADLEAARLRGAATAAVATLIGAELDLVAVVGVAEGARE